MTHGLGRIPPTDQKHELKYPFQLARTTEHAERVLKLPYAYRPKYDQGSEGACVGYAASWAMSILNRRFYDAFWLYKEAQKIDEWPGEDYSGTSVRAGMDVLRDVGHKLMHKHDHDHLPELDSGIFRNEWARSTDQIRTCIAGGTPVVIGVDWMSNFDTPVLRGREYWIGEGDLGRMRGGHAICAYGASDRRQAVKLVNSWGSSYELVWMPYDTLQRLIDGIAYPGEATIISDRIVAGERT